MASGAARPSSGRSDSSGADKGRSAKPRSSGRKIEYQAYIDGELRKTRSRVKWVDIGSSLTLLASAVLAYLLVAALADHWLVSGGLGFFGRLVLCLGLVGGVAYHLIGRLAPLLLRKVNPVYAAEAIERSQPMKNTLINFLLLRKQPHGHTEQLLDAMKEQAAVRLSAVPADAPVDRSGLIRLGYVLCAVLIALVVYALAGPKDMFTSVGRVVAPWADIAAPTRVRIVEIIPGNIERRRDEVVEVKVRTRSARTQDQATIYYSNTGKAEDDVAQPLKTEDLYDFTATIPGGADGLKQDLYYYVKIGDAESSRFRIRVAATPVISVASVRYEYPAYTGLPPRDAGRQADLRGLEGTRVVMTAETNQKMKSAYAMFDASRQRDVELVPDDTGLRAVGSFKLTLTKDRTQAAHKSYLLRFANIDGQENPKPIEHRIEVTPDQAPEVKVAEPTTPDTQVLNVPLGTQVRISLAARDPDFKLAELAVVFERTGKLLREDILLNDTNNTEYSNTLLFEPSQYGLKAGDRVTFRGRAKDNKAPTPNVSHTPRYTIVVAQGSGIQQPPKADDRNQQNPNAGNPQQNPQQRNQQQPNGGRQGNQPQQPQPNGPQEGKPENNPQQQPDGNAQQRDQRPNGAQQNNNPQNGNPQNNDQRNGPRDQAQPNQGRQGDQNSQQKPNQDGMPPMPGEGQRQQGNNSSDKPQDGQGESGKQSSGEPSGSKQGENGGANGGEADKPIDPEVKPGEAVEALKNHFDKKDGKQPQQNKPDGAGKNEQGRGEQPKNNQGRSDQNGNGEQQPGNNEGLKPNQDPNKKNGPQQGTEKGSEKGSKPGDANGGEASDPNGKGRDPAQKPGGQDKPQEKKNEGESEAGAPSGAGQQKGSEAGKEGSDAQSGGGASGQQSSRSGNQAGSPGGNEGKPTDQPSGGNAERREGKNDGGREIDRKPTDGNNGGEKTQAAGDKPADMSNAKPTDQTGGQQPGEKPTTDAPMPGTGTQAKDGGNEPAPKSGTGNDGNPTPDREGKQSNTGDGGRSGSASNKPDAKPSGTSQPKNEAAGGQGAKPSDNAGEQSGNQKNKGQPGSGSSNEGTPQAQEQTKPKNNTTQGPGESARSDDESKSDEGKSPGNGKNESDTQSDSSGDKKGQGEKGGGMRSKKEGTGASGENTPADQGAGASSEEGDSVAGNKPGDKTRGQAPKSGNPNDAQPSGEKGDGNRTRAGGDQPGGEGESESGKPKSNDSSSRNSKNGSSSPNANQPLGEGTPPTGGSEDGTPNGNRPQRNPNRERESNPAAAEAANMEYSKKATDLVLNRLKQQLDKGEVDPELLKKFGSKEAMENWVRSYREMERRARQAGAQGDAARKEFDDYHKGLGLQSPTAAQQGRRTGDDDSRDLRGSRRSEPPAKFADQYRAYTTGVGQEAPPAKQP